MVVADHGHDRRQDVAFIAPPMHNLTKGEPVIEVPPEDLEERIVVRVKRDGRRLIRDLVAGFQGIFAPHEILREIGLSEWQAPEDVRPNGSAEGVKVNKLSKRVMG